MGKYIVKRILLMIPTFFAISLIVFLVMHAAPGQPGASVQGAGDASQDADQGAENEAYTLFKQQFNLDKPVLFNTRYGLSDEEVLSAIEDSMNFGGEVLPGRQIEAKEQLTDWAQYAVPGLLKVLTEHPDKSIRSRASKWLSSAAKLRLQYAYTKRPTKEQLSSDSDRMKHNLEIKTWTFEENATDTAEAEVVSKWTAYVEEDVERRWHFTMGSKLSTLLLDTQFAKYWSNILSLDFGVSHLYKEDVLSLVGKKLRYSICLSVATLLIIYLVSVPLGIWSAVYRNTPADRAVTVFLFMLYSLPSFWVATILLNFLTKGTPFEVLPTGGFSSIDAGNLTTLDYLKDVIWHITLPVACMTYGGLAALSRYARTGLLDVIQSDYVRTARAKGLSEAVVIIKHAGRNGMIPIITLMATLLPALIGGSVVIEFIFQIPGIGSFMFESIQARDYNVVMCILLITSLLTLIGMLLADLLYALVDPRITFD
ncbi:MAG: ABC transporter permease [Myxococcota bacterium]|nr:ABC transporter permease [Myxococcota bacterium]